MTKENIALSLVFVVAATIFVSVVAYVLNTKAPEGVQTNEPAPQNEAGSATLAGTIIDINTGARSLGIESDEKLVTVALASDAELFNERGDAVLLQYFEYSFSVSASGRFTGENTFLAERIRITGTPAVIILSPRQNDEAASPLTIYGKARGAKQEILFRLIDGDVGVLTEGKMVTGNPTESGYSSFQTTIVFPSPKSGGGFLEIYVSSAQESALTVPIRFKQ